MSTLADTPDSKSPTSRAVIVLLFVLSVIVLPVATNAVQVQRFQALSRLDEPAHIDYLRQVYDFHLPRVGERLLNDTREDISCRTIDGRALGRCEDVQHPIGVYDAEGYAYEAQQPPLYYAATAILMRPVGLVVNGFVNSARLIGALWTSAGLALLWWCLRARRGASPVATALVCTILAMTPLVVTQTATVNNDSAALLIGAAVLVGYHLLREDRRGWVIALSSLVAVVLVFTKPLAILPIGAATVALLADLILTKRSVRALVPAALPGIAALVSYQVWQQIRDVRAILPYDTVTDALLGFRAPIDGFRPSVAAGVVNRFLAVYWTTDGPLAAAPYVAAFAMVLGLCFIVSPSISTAMGDGAPDLRRLQVAVLFVALVAPPLLVVQSYLDVRRLGGANARYALSMLPLVIPAAVPWLERRGPRWFAAALTAALGVGIFYSLATAEAPPL